MDPFFKETLRLSRQLIVHVFPNFCNVFSANKRIITERQIWAVGKVFKGFPMYYCQFIDRQNRCVKSLILTFTGSPHPSFSTLYLEIKHLGQREGWRRMTSLMGIYVFCFCRRLSLSATAGNSMRYSPYVDSGEN